MWPERVRTFTRQCRLKRCTPSGTGSTRTCTETRRAPSSTLFESSGSGCWNSSPTYVPQSLVKAKLDTGTTSLTMAQYRLCLDSSRFPRWRGLECERSNNLWFRSEAIYRPTGEARWCLSYMSIVGDPGILESYGRGCPWKHLRISEGWTWYQLTSSSSVSPQFVSRVTRH